MDCFATLAMTVSGRWHSTARHTLSHHRPPTGRANARPITGSAKPSRAPAVIASEAKQSILPRKGRMDCFAALAMTWNCRRDFTPSPRNAPEALMYLPPKEGVGNAGCPLHPRPRVHLVVVERTRVIWGKWEQKYLSENQK